MEWIDEKEGKNMPRDVRVTDASGNDRLSNLESKINELHEAFIINKDAGVTLNGSNVELYGATVNDRPAADAVKVGAVYMAVDTQEIWQSNGTEWKVIN